MPTKMTIAHSKTLEDLYANTAQNERTGCLEWQGFCKPYGWVWNEGKNQYAHRLAFGLANNVQLTRSDHVCHTCDNPRCINAEHLFLGDAKVNYEDAKSKGRHCYGEHHGNSKLTEDEVRVIRTLNETDMTQEEIAIQFEVSPATVSHIVTRRLWAWLD
jgi:hypothetical protein